MQIHYALKATPRWRAGEELSKVALLHLTLVSMAFPDPPMKPNAVFFPQNRRSASASRHRSIPAARRMALPFSGCRCRIRRAISRAMRQRACLPADGRWTEALREAFADRIEAMLRAQIENFDEIVLKRRAYAPTDLEAMNMNLVGGDPYGGFCGLDQFFLWRPFKSSVNHKTHVAGLYHIGASTHPGRVLQAAPVSCSPRLCADKGMKAHG